MVISAHLGMSFSLVRAFPFSFPAYPSPLLIPFFLFIHCSPRFRIPSPVPLSLLFPLSHLLFLYSSSHTPLPSSPPHFPFPSPPSSPSNVTRLPPPLPFPLASSPPSFPPFPLPLSFPFPLSLSPSPLPYLYFSPLITPHE